MILLLLFCLVTVAHADCRGLKENPTFSNVCDPDGFRDSAARIKTGKQECTYSNTITGTDCTGMKTKTQYDKLYNKCKPECPAFRETKLTLGGTRYIFQENTYKENPCNNNTGLNPQSDISEFVCKDKDTGFLCEMDTTDNTKFYCGCKNAEGGIFSDTCTFTSNSEILTIIFAIIGGLLACVFIYYIYTQCNKNNKLAPV